MELELIKKEMEKKLNILVVEDDKYMSETLCEILKDEGFEVENSFAANEAIGKINLNEDKYGMLVVDYNLRSQSNLTGIDVFAAAKKNNPNVKGIMISAYGNSKIKERAIKEGIDICLDKPFMINDLINSVNDLRFILQSPDNK